MKKSQTSILVECALLLALAVVLAEVLKFEMPYGGSITVFSMVPILMASFRHGTKWGLLTSFTYSLIELFFGFKNVLYCKTLGAQAICILFDYVIAFTVLGLAVVFSKPFGGAKSRVGVGLGSALAILLRFCCHFFSGVTIWGEYAPEGTPVWLYSLSYNVIYMLPELILAVVAMVLLQRLAAPRAQN